MAGLDSFTKLLTHMNSDFSDSSFSAHGVTLVNTPTIDTSVKKFGAGSGNFTSAGQSVYYTGTLSDFGMGTGDFTVDFWLYFTSGPPSVNPIQVTESAANNNFDIFYRHSSTRVEVYLNNVQYNFTTTFSATTWYHVAVTRNGTNLRVFVNGTQIGSTLSSSDNVPTPATFLKLANSWNDANTPQLNLDEYRISKGIARWTANFTPESAEYSADVLVSSFHKGNFMQPDCSRGILM